MPLTLRLSKGSRLTWQEGDDNFAGLASGALLEAGALAAKVFTSLTLSGVLLASDGNIGAPGIAFANQPNLGIYRAGSNTIGITAGSAAMLWDNAVLYLQTNGAQIYMGAANDLQLHREAANVLAQKRGTNPQQLRLYNTFTDGSNYERLIISASAGAAEIYTDQAGTGVARPLDLGSAGVSRWRLAATGELIPLSDAAYDIGQVSGGNRVRNLYVSTRVTIGGGIDSEALRLIAADSVGDGYMTFYSSNGSTRRGYIGYGSTTNNSLQIANDSVDEHLFLLTAGSSNIVFNIASTDAGRIGREGQYGIINLMAGQATGISGTGFNLASGSSDQTLYLNSPNGLQMRVNNVNGFTVTAGGVNYLNAQGAGSGNAPNLSAVGGDTNVNLAFVSKGNGSHYFFTQDVDTTSRRQVSIDHVAGADNFISMKGGNGVPVTIQSAGGNTDIGFDVLTKGAGNFRVWSGGGTAIHFLVSHIASAVNYLRVQGSSTGNDPIVKVEGSDTNISLRIITSGAGSTRFESDGGGGPVQFRVGRTASAVNNFVVFGSSTTLALTMQAEGSDSDIGIQHITKGLGVFSFYSNSGSVEIMRIETQSSVVNRLNIIPSPTTIPVGIAPQGSDSNISFYIQPKGTGEVQILGPLRIEGASIIQNSQSANYTAVLTDANKHLLHPSTDANARTFTIPANASVAYAIGTCLTFVNRTPQVLTIAINSDTLIFAGVGTTGSRSLADNSTATALKIEATTWIISGTGLT